MLKVTVLSYTPAPEQLTAAAARLCYSDEGIDALFDDMTPERVGGFLDRLTALGHQSPIEHASFTFGIEGVSRSLLAQITRHRIASFSVKSQRYVLEEGFRYVVPPSVKDDPRAKAAFVAAMDAAQQSYITLLAALTARRKEELLKAGESERTALIKAERLAAEDARFVLPNACATQMIVTMNARSLYNFFALRCCSRAQWEIRALADEMLRLVLEVAPHLFATAGPGCVSGPCTEGRMSCGKMQEMREKYAVMRGEQ